MKVAAYIRVSTDEQTAENQSNVLTKWASDRGWEVGEVYHDIGSAFQHTDQRELKRLLADCDKGKYKQVIVYDLSRLTRKGPLELMLLLKQFADKGAPVFSYLDTAINVPGEFQPVLVAFYGVMARIFSTQLSERTKAGMARAKANGKHVGRPSKEMLKARIEARNSYIGMELKKENMLLNKRTKKKLENIKSKMTDLNNQLAKIQDEKGDENINPQA